MKRKYIYILTVVIAISLLVLYLFNSPAENFKEANLKLSGGQRVLALKGKRVLMSHDIISVLKQKTYIDSIYILIPFTGNGILKGEEIEVKKGYKYKGEIKIEDENVDVDLYYDNIDDKALVPSGWNGTYNLNRDGL